MLPMMSGGPGTSLQMASKAKRKGKAVGSKIATPRTINSYSSTPKNRRSDLS